MITAVVFLLIVVTVPLLGGRLSRLGEIRLQQWWWIVASLITQFVLIGLLSKILDGVVAASLHIASFGMAFVFVWKNRHIVGMGIMVLGGILNAAAVSANGGVMPARLEALGTAGIISDSPKFENSAPVDDARLAFLGDVFAIPEGIPFANVFSIGDLLLVFGAGFTVHVVAQSKLGQLVRRSTDEIDPGSPPEPVPHEARTCHSDQRASRESLAIRYARSIEARRADASR